MKKLTFAILALFFGMCAYAQEASTTHSIGFKLNVGSSYGGELSYRWHQSVSHTEIGFGIGLPDLNDESYMATEMVLSQLWHINANHSFQWIVGPSLQYRLDLDDNGYTGHNFGLGATTGPEYRFNNGLALGLFATGKYMILGSASGRGFLWNAGLTLSYRL